MKNKIKFYVVFAMLVLLSNCTSPFNTATPVVETSSLPLARSVTQESQLNLSEMKPNQWASTSPDGKWIAVGLVAFPKENIGGQPAYIRLMIFSADGKSHWTIIDEWQDLNLGFPIPEPLKWSQDGKYFFFTYRVTPDGCSAFPFLTDLQQVTLENGTTDDLLPDSALALALSPDDSQVAYFEKGLILRDLTTGEERETVIDPGKDFNVGNILWSPDGNALALTLAIKPCTGPYGVSKTVWAESTSIIWVDAKSLQKKILVREDPRLFITVEWNEPEKIVITDGNENSVWHLDVTTAEITRP